MPYEEDDLEYEHQMEVEAEYQEDTRREQFYAELYDTDIKYFVKARLQAYYRAHPLVLQAPLDALNEARSLAPNHPSAALVFAVAATEVCINAALLKPIFYGLVHTETAADFIMDLAIAPQQEHFVEIMHKILANHGGVNLRGFKRSESGPPLWTEIRTLRDRRNKVVHRCEKAFPKEAAQAIGVAEVMIETIFPMAIATLGLHLHEGMRVCDGTVDMDCPGWKSL